MKTAKSYLKPFIFAMACYPFAFVIAALLHGAVYPNPILRFIVMLIPVIPCIFALIYFVRAIGSLDEMQRRIQLEAFAFSLGGVVLAGVTIGMLSLAFDSIWGTPNWSWISLLAVFLWGIGQFIAARRYQ